MSSLPVSVLIVTAALFLNCLLVIAGGPYWMIAAISLAGPFLILWMVMHVLTDRRGTTRMLADGEEWGYQDRPDLRPGR